MGPTRCAKAAERVFAASLTELEALGMPASSVQFVGDGRARVAAEQEIGSSRRLAGDF
ncbi:MAG TPA: hypothetical protein VNW54_06455 [Granulicella sp.]|jgi:DNA processing protein|nr:hypothetical protein [Granulicella sp.]